MRWLVSEKGGSDRITSDNEKQTASTTRRLLLPQKRGNKDNLPPTPVTPQFTAGRGAGGRLWDVVGGGANLWIRVFPRVICVYM